MEKRVVWILGAGFSVPLGGPLFRELISKSTQRRLLTWEDYAQQKWMAPRINSLDSLEPSAVQVSAAVSAQVVCRLYELGVQPPYPLWSDAEQFLERLGIAAEEPGQLTEDIKTNLQRVKEQTHGGPEFEPAYAAFKTDLTLLHTEAIRFVAGACCAFLLRAEQNPKVVDESEQWDPYRRWVSLLKGGSDTVITFNYDRTLDMLAEHCRREGKTDNLLARVGGTEHRFETFRKSCVPMLHLHGHVGWQRGNDGSIVAQPQQGGFQVNPAVAHRLPGTAVIGVPGASKLSLPEGLLRFEWEQAVEAIQYATAVVFVGYRFPETDNMAKRRLIDALKKNPDMAAHVLLGTNNDDRPRLVGMIDWTRNRHNNPVRVHELWAQDFFAVFERDGL